MPVRSDKESLTGKILTEQDVGKTPGGMDWQLRPSLTFRNWNLRCHEYVRRPIRALGVTREEVITVGDGVCDVTMLN